MNNIQDFNPKVSIIIPVYNGSTYLREAIDSALSQTYSNIEVLVVNDGSNDAGMTHDIAFSYGDKIRYFKKENGGVSSALNLGISKMTGKYFSWLSHDDVYTENKILNQVYALSQIGNSVTIVCCNSVEIDKNSNLINNIKKRLEFKSETLQWDQALKLMLEKGEYGGCSFLIPKKVLDEVGGFDEALRYNQDVVMWYKIFLAKVNVLFNPEIDVKIRIHDSQLSRTGKDIFVKDSNSASHYLIPLFINNSQRYNFLFLYAKRMAVYNIKSVVDKCILEAKHDKLFGARDLIVLKSLCVWGKFRPIIKRLYYKVFKKVRTQ